jgi:uncharacterized phage protein (TIGR02218 family)
MRAATQRLQDILASRQFVKCNLFTFTLISGLSYHWTDADVDIVAAGQIYSSSGPSISGAKYQLVRGLQVSTLDLTVLFKPSDQVAGVPWFVARQSGALDNAVVRIDKAFMPAWGDPAETLLIFQGTVGTMDDGEQALYISVVSDANRLNTKIPKLLFQPSCQRTLYAPGCNANRAAATASGNVAGAPTRSAFNTNLAAHEGYFGLGVIIFTSGLNSGVRRSVRAFSQAGGRVELSYPLEFDLSVGDAFTIRAGCDKTRGVNGCAKFFPVAEIVHKFKGTPYVPQPETAI